MPSGRTAINHHFLNEIAFGALASEAAVIDGTLIDPSRLQGSKIRKLKAWCYLKSKTVDEGPVVCGFSIGATAVEVAEALVADPQRHEDVGKSEEGNRKVFPIWVFGKNVISSPGSTPNGDSHWLRDVGFPSWTVPEGVGLDFFAFNADANPLTAGGSVEWGYTAITIWERD